MLRRVTTRSNKGPWSEVATATMAARATCGASVARTGFYRWLMRMRMSARLDESLPAPAIDAMARSVTPADAPALARLMLDAYRGTADDGGEGPDQAAAEVAKLLAGGYGNFDFASSEVVSRDDVIVSATLVTEYDGGAMVAFSMTAPAWQRRGLARAGLLRTMTRLRHAGRDRVDLAVTSANTPAVTLYRAMGFREVPR